MYTSETKISIDAPIEKIWEYLIKPELAKEYFFHTNIVTSWRIGELIYFRGVREGQPYEDKGIVLEFTPFKTLTFNYWSSFTGVPDTPENYQVIKQELVETQNGVELKVTQSKAPTQEKADQEIKNWNLVFENLKKILETKL